MYYRGEKPITKPMNNQSMNTKNNKKANKGHKDLFRGSCACRHASPRCVDLYLVVRSLIGIHKPKPTLGCHKNLPQAR